MLLQEQSALSSTFKSSFHPVQEFIPSDSRVHSIWFVFFPQTGVCNQSIRDLFLKVQVIVHVRWAQVPDKVPPFHSSAPQPPLLYHALSSFRPMCMLERFAWSLANTRVNMQQWSSFKYRPSILKLKAIVKEGMSH